MIIIFVEFNFRNAVNGSLNSINMILKKRNKILLLLYLHLSGVNRILILIKRLDLIKDIMEKIQLSEQDSAVSGTSGIPQTLR